MKRVLLSFVNRLEIIKRVLLKKYTLGRPVDSVKTWEGLIERFINLDNLRSGLSNTCMNNSLLPFCSSLSFSVEEGLQSN